MNSKLEFPHGNKRFWDDQVTHLISNSEAGDEAATASLLNWLKDMNWPGSSRASEHLLQYWKHVIPEIKEILRGDDEVWQHWLILQILDQLTVDEVSMFEAELTCLAIKPSDDIVDLSAGMILSKSKTVPKKTMQQILAALETRYLDDVEKMEQIRRNVSAGQDGDL